MRTLITLTALLVLAVSPLAAQDARCPFDATATGGGFYRVLVSDSVVSQHTRLDQAIERASIEETQAPPDSVVIDHDFRLRVECPTDWSLRLAPERVDDLRAVSATDSSLVFAWTEVDDGTGSPAQYELRLRPVSDSTHWLHPSLVVLSGSCAWPIAGTGIGAEITCEATGLVDGVEYEGAVRAFRDEPPS